MYSQNVKPTMSLGESLTSVFNKYATFTGRARRSEFWWFTICYYVIVFFFNIASIAFLMQLFTGEITPTDPSYMLFLVTGIVVGLGLFIPSLSVTVRRLHDIGKSGWNLLWAAIPIVGVIIVLVCVWRLYCL